MGRLASLDASTVSDTTVTRERLHLPRRHAAAWGVVVWPRELTQVVALEGGRGVGRAPPADGHEPLRLDHPTVSRSHARLAPAGTRLQVQDLGGRNGSALNGRRLGAAPADVAAGDVLRFGDVLMVVSERPDGALGVAATPSFPFATQSARMAAALRALDLAAPDPAPLLVSGETGAGKEAVAREAHRRSGRAGPFVAVNCAELSRELIEAQLFGHERGAFTGAGEARQGLFRAAHRGTLFLDEVGELPLDLQPKLLRVLQEREVRAVGATRATPVDVRVVSATNRDLNADVEAGRFRRDLWARLTLWELRLPPLRERREDLLAWLDLLVARFATSRGLPPTLLDLDAEAAEALLLAEWPDNLRGLDRLAHRLAARPAGAGRVHPAELAALGVSARREAPEGPAGVDRLQLPTREAFVAAYAEHSGSVRGLARHFGRDRRQIYRWIAAYGLDAGDAPAADPGHDPDA